MKANLRYGGHQATTHIQYIYTTPEIINQFKTKKLLGLKSILIKATPTEEATSMLDLKAEGIIEIAHFYDAITNSMMLRLKLK